MPSIVAFTIESALKRAATGLADGEAATVIGEGVGLAAVSAGVAADTPSDDDGLTEAPRSAAGEHAVNAARVTAANQPLRIAR